MADYYPARITFGGKINSVQKLYNTGPLAEIKKYVIENELVVYSSEITIKTPALFNEMLDDHKGKAITLFLEETRWGEFEGLEETLRKHNLPYRRFTAQNYEEDPYTTYWIPGMKEPKHIPCSCDGDPVVTVEAVRTAMKDKKTLQKLVDEYTLPDIPPLEVT